MTYIKWPADWPNTVWTDDEWHQAMLHRLDHWLTWDKHDAKRPKVHKWMGMSSENFINWRSGFIPVPRTTRILWSMFPEELEFVNC